MVAGMVPLIKLSGRVRRLRDMMVKIDDGRVPWPAMSGQENVLVVSPRWRSQPGNNDKSQQTHDKIS